MGGREGRKIFEERGKEGRKGGRLKEWGDTKTRILEGTNNQ